MSYMSGIMMGMALGKGIRQCLGGGQSGGFFPGGGQGGGRQSGGFFPGGGQVGRKGQGGQGRASNRDLSGLKDYFRRKAAPAMTLARAIPGRRRYYVRALLGNEPLAAAVNEALSRLSCMDEVRANPVTGSLLLVYHGDEAAVDAIAARLADRVFTPPERAALLLEEAETDLAAVGRSIRRTTTALSQRLRMISNGWFDLPSLLALFFALQGVQKLLLTKQLPSGPQLLWWSFSLLRGWRIA